VKSSFGIETTVIPLRDGRSHFAYPKTAGAVILEGVVAVLWLVSVAVAAAVLF
jgi:hypothetical protein